MENLADKYLFLLEKFKKHNCIEIAEVDLRHHPEYHPCYRYGALNVFVFDFFDDHWELVLDLLPHIFIRFDGDNLTGTYKDKDRINSVVLEYPEKNYKVKIKSDLSEWLVDTLFDYMLF